MSEPEKVQPETSAAFEEVFEITWSGTFSELVKALAKAQLSYKPVLKQNENEAFTRGNRKSFYADLATYIDATQKALAENGLVVIQWPTVATHAESMSLISILAHSSGEWMRGKLTLPAGGRNGFTPQSCGSSITYARRYSYAAITGCAAEDDDGNAASGQGTAKAAQDEARRQLEAKTLSDDPKIREIAKQGLSKLDAKASGNGQESQEQPHADARRIVWIKILPNSDVAVNGYLADEPMLQFLSDVSAEKKRGKTGGNYYQFAPNYLPGFKELCEKQEIEIA
jgi:hypothetical protein